MVSFEILFITHDMCCAFQLFSTNLVQMGEETGGIRRFLLRDIRNVIKDSKQIVCIKILLPRNINALITRFSLNIYNRHALLALNRMQPYFVAATQIVTKKCI